MQFLQYKSVNFMNNPLHNKRNWTGPPEVPLTGFTKQNRTVRLSMWSDVFLHDSTSEKIAIVLADMQGLSHNSGAADERDNEKIFALGTLISSIQIFNVLKEINDYDLNSLQKATDLAEYISKESEK